MDKVFPLSLNMTPITDPAEEYFKDGLWGWAPSTWRKLPLLWGYSAIWDENLGGAATGTTYFKASTAIPAGELWVAQAVSIRNKTRDTTGVSISVPRASTGVLFLANALTLARWNPLLITGTFVLRQGDLINVYMASTQAGDAIEAAVAGYKMGIT